MLIVSVQVDFYAWEVVEAGRKFLLIGFARLPFLDPGTSCKLHATRLHVISYK